MKNIRTYQTKSMLKIDVNHLGNITIIEASGRLDGLGAAHLQQKLDDVREAGHSRLILDCAGVEYLSGAGVKLLKKLQLEIGKVRLSRPSERVIDVLQIVGLDDTFALYGTRTEAIRAITPICNAHTHLELGWLSPYRPGVDGAPFVEWIRDTVMKQSARLGATAYETRRTAAESGIKHLLDAGITTVGDISTTGASIEPLLQSGLSGIVYVEVLGPWSNVADERMNRARELIEKWRPKERNGMRIGLSIHAPYTTHPVLWEKALAYACQEDLPLCIHAAESPAEWEFCNMGTGPIAENNVKLGVDFASPLRTPIQYLEDLGALERKPLLVHAVEVTTEDIRRIKSSGSSVVHCPRSNLRLHCKRMPLEKYLVAGVPVYIGTDSLGSSPSLDIFEEVEVAVALHYDRVLPEHIQAMLYQPLPN